MSTLIEKTYTYTEISQTMDISVDELHTYIEQSWLVPFDHDNSIFDHEDVARLKLILDLKRQMGANDASIPIILHLVDQLYIHTNK